jgi:hypothetical protein
MGALSQQFAYCASSVFLLFDRSRGLNGNEACLLLTLQKLHFKLEFVEQ